MTNPFCALGCSHNKDVYIFPSRKSDKKRRKIWLNFFDMEEPNIGSVFACERHFSPLQTTSKGLRPDAIPDKPVVCDGVVHPFRRKPKNWRKNVIVVTPRDPEFTIYRHHTGVFPQNLFDTSEKLKPIIQMPIIKSVSCSMSTQTNKRFCGFVEISDIKEEYRLNCFYCSEMFEIEKWSTFVDHLKNIHFEREEAFKMSKSFLRDHDYTLKYSPMTTPVNLYNKSEVLQSAIIERTHPTPIFLDSNMIPSLLAKPQNCLKKSTENILKIRDTLPPPLVSKPQQLNDKSFNISLADKVIKLLNETILSSKFLPSEEDNILIIKNTGSEKIDTSSFLNNLINSKTGFSPTPKKSNAVKLKNSTFTTPPPNNSRSIYTINHGRKDIPFRRNSLSRLLLLPLPKNKNAKLLQKRIAQQTLKNINLFESIYKTVKTRPPKVAELEREILNDPNGNKVTDQQILNSTPLSRCLRRTEMVKTLPKKKKTTEIVFEYTPEDIVISLLESMKKFPVLWEFHDQAFNKQYIRAVEDLCKIINNKWAVNITFIKMRRSINRILRFYRFMLPCESIDKFEDYFDKCALFLPSSVDDIPRARCAYCCICFKKDSELRKHIIDRHKAFKWPYKCQHCLERFRESDEYELHKRLPHYEEIFKCQYCDKRFNRLHLHNKHVASHERSIERRKEAQIYNDKCIIFEHECDVCKKRYSSISELNRHKMLHKVEKMKCHLCQKELSTKWGLRYHLKKHNKELDYICEVCGKGFVKKSYLEGHMDTHTGAKITCKICNIKLRKCSLSRHLRLVHVPIEGTIESAYRAKSHRYRKFIFSKTGTVYKRRPAETPRKYNCKICKMPFVRLKLLKDHNKLLHADVKRTPCRICSIEFIHIHNLKRHYRSKHKLHVYQVFKLLDPKEDLDTILAMKDFENMTDFDVVSNSRNNQADNYFKEGRMHSDKIQDEIMKAVENLDDQEIQVDDDKSMNNFFTELFKNS